MFIKCAGNIALSFFQLSYCLLYVICTLLFTVYLCSCITKRDAGQSKGEPVERRLSVLLKGIIANKNGSGRT